MQFDDGDHGESSVTSQSPGPGMTHGEQSPANRGLQVCQQEDGCPQITISEPRSTDEAPHINNEEVQMTEHEQILVRRIEELEDIISDLNFQLLSRERNLEAEDVNMSIFLDESLQSGPMDLASGRTNLNIITCLMPH